MTDEGKKTEEGKTEEGKTEEGKTHEDKFDPRVTAQVIMRRGALEDVLAEAERADPNNPLFAKDEGKDEAKVEDSEQYAALQARQNALELELAVRDALIDFNLPREDGVFLTGNSTDEVKRQAAALAERLKTTGTGEGTETDKTKTAEAGGTAGTQGTEIKNETETVYTGTQPTMSVEDAEKALTEFEGKGELNLFLPPEARDIAGQ